MTRKYLDFFLLMIFFFPGMGLCSQTGSLGLGAIIGDPTGIDGKYWLTEKTAIDGLIGVHFGGRPDHYCTDDFYTSDDKGNHILHSGNCGDQYSQFEIHSDFLVHYDPFTLAKGRIPLDVGVGFRFLTPNTELGLRIPVGISYLFQNVPIDIFAEIVPVVVVSPYAGLDLDGGIGMRFYFGNWSIHRT